MRYLCAIAVVAILVRPIPAADVSPKEKIPILLDCDIGTDIDDAFALALVLHSPELDLRGVTTVSGDTMARARMCCRLLTAAGRKDVPVAAGPKDKPAQELRGMQHQYAAHPAVVYGRTSKPVKEGAVEFLYSKLKGDPGKLTIVAVGPLSNIAQLLTEHPDCKPWIKRIVLMGGSVRVGYDAKPKPEPEFNLYTDVKAAQTVFSSGVPLTVAPLDASAMLKLEPAMLKRIFDAGSLLNMQVQCLYQLWDQKDAPIMFDPVAVTLAFNDSFCKMEELCLEVDDKGMTKETKGKPNARVATSIKKDEYLKWLVDRFANGAPKAPAPKKPGNLSKLIERTGLPNRVHTFEDFETDIEKRWWMAGKGEAANVPLGSTRACRGVLTQDFDDLMGDLATMYTAVVFNPVPGPPMGKNPRLSFRYWLKGTDTLRIQIYSLSKGYHRYLTLTGLLQEKWQSGTVDMTQVRRPDGSGGPLSEEERIDDVQFYVEPTAELIIDDMCLYDAAPEGEKRLYPNRFLFTGWFDSGKQGKEWPGTFEIAAKKGYFWNAAKSVDNPKLDAPWIQLGLRGPRPLGETTHLVFRYRLESADAMKVVLVNRTQKAEHAIELKALKKGDWAQAFVDFTASPVKPHKGDKVDEIQFLLPKGAELLIDDLLLYEPGAAP
jgi:inosine-uridine nucleoside N-ribohydrolase